MQIDVEKLQNRKYNIELVLRHNKRLEAVINKIYEILNKGYDDFDKINMIEKIIENAKKYV